MSNSGPDRLGALLTRYRAALPGRLAAIEQAWARARRGDTEALEDLHTLAHRMAGSGGMYGLPGVSAAARALVDHLQPSLAPDAALTAPAIAQIDTALARLAESVRSGLAGDDPP